MNKKVSTRHKWEKKIHKYIHEVDCLKCGCVKDTSNLGVTLYWLNGEKHYHAPPCEPKADNSQQSNTP